MSVSTVLQTLLPTLIPIAIGYAVARWVGISMQPIATLLRTVFLPAILFMALREHMAFHVFLLLIVIGGAMAFAGTMFVHHAHRFLKPRVDRSAALLNIACFSLPFFALSLSSRGLATACALFVGVAVTSCAIETRSARPLLREPWTYGVLAALIFQALGASTQWMDPVVTPLASSAFIMFLLFVGAALHPTMSLRNAEAWATVAVRLVSGAAVGLLAIVALPISGIVAQAVMLTALAPPATHVLAMHTDGGEADSGNAASSLGTLVSLVVIGALFVAGWPWRL